MKQFRRPHHIPEWMSIRGLSKAELARRAGVAPSMVTRWFKGSTPCESHQETLATVFGTDRDGLFAGPPAEAADGSVPDVAPVNRRAIPRATEPPIDATTLRWLLTGSYTSMGIEEDRSKLLADTLIAACRQPRSEEETAEGPDQIRKIGALLTAPFRR